MGNATAPGRDGGGGIGCAIHAGGATRAPAAVGRVTEEPDPGYLEYLKWCADPKRDPHAYVETPIGWLPRRESSPTPATPSASAWPTRPEAAAHCRVSLRTFDPRFAPR